MPTYVAFLRAINLGAKRKFPKDAIRAAVEGTGCMDVETYINTGNVRLTTTLRSRAKVEKLLEDAFLADRGFAVPTIVVTPAELTAIAEAAAGWDHQGRHFVELLKDEPSASTIEAVEALTDDTRVARVGGRALHLMIAPDADYATAAVLRKSITAALGVSTNRNATVIRDLAARWGA